MGIGYIQAEKGGSEMKERRTAGIKRDETR